MKPQDRVQFPTLALRKKRTDESDSDVLSTKSEAQFGMAVPAIEGHPHSTGGRVVERYAQFPLAFESGALLGIQQAVGNFGNGV